VRFRFASKKLEKLYTSETGAEQYQPAVVEAFFEVMAAIDSAVDERDLRKLQGLHYEALKGRRKGEYSLRLNKQLRLIVEREVEAGERVLAVTRIEDYH
jgi:proteic killer suppression protein